MVRRKIYSVLLVILLLFILCSCYRDNEGVIQTAEEYAKAVIALDPDGIAACMYNDSNVEEAFAEYNQIIKDSPDTKDVYDFIADSMTYDIDTQSVQVLSNGETASCNITFTMVDYEGIYNTAGNKDEYIDVLYNCDSDKTTSITVSVKFVFQDGKWLINDRTCKNLDKVYRFVEVIDDYALFSEALSLSEYKDAIKEVFDPDQAELFRSYGKEWEVIGFLRYDYSDFTNTDIYIFKYDSSDAADEFFAKSIAESEYDLSDEKIFCDEDEGIVLFNDYNDCKYGGCYLKSDTMIYALVYEGDEAEKALIDEFLTTIDCPTPKEYFQ